MSVTLTPQLESKIRERVESGRYESASEVVAEALRLLELVERRDRLRASLTESWEQHLRGESVELTPEWEAEAIERSERRFLAGEMPNPDVCP